MPRVLVTGVGAAPGIGFVKGIREGFKNQGLFVVGVDSSSMAAGFYSGLVDVAARVPMAKSSSYIKRVLGLCKANKVDVVVPCTDHESHKISVYRKRFERLGVKCLVSKPDTVRACRDKWETYLRLGEFMPKTFDSGSISDAHDLSFPVIVKPRSGGGSKNQFVVNSIGELELAVRSVRDCIVQEFVGGREYSIDCLVGRNGFVGASPRERIEKFAGLCSKGRIVASTRLLKFVKGICSKLDFYGPINIQVIMHRCGEPKLIEINPRFPGTGVLTIAAGFNIPHLAVLDVLGFELPKFKIKNDLMITRFVDEVFFERGGLI